MDDGSAAPVTGAAALSAAVWSEGLGLPAHPVPASKPAAAAKINRNSVFIATSYAPNGGATRGSSARLPHRRVAAAATPRGNCPVRKTFALSESSWRSLEVAGYRRGAPPTSKPVQNRRVEHPFARPLDNGICICATLEQARFGGRVPKPSGIRVSRFQVEASRQPPRIGREAPPW